MLIGAFGYVAAIYARVVPLKNFGLHFRLRSLTETGCLVAGAVNRDLWTCGSFFGNALAWLCDVNLDVQISYVAGAAFCEPRSTNLLGGATFCESRRHEMCSHTSARDVRH